jgi:Na+-driven multidrug efflux pump
VVSVGSSSLFRNGLIVISAIMLNNIAGSMSDSVLAAVGVSNKIMMFPFCIILGFGNGFQPVAGFNWGAKRYDRVEESYKFSARISLIGSLIMAVIIALFCDKLIVLFAGTDAEMRRIGAFCILAQCIALPVHAWVAIVNMLCVGLGNAKGAMLLATARQGTCFIPVVHIMASLLGAYGVASVQALADVLSLALAFPLMIAMRKKISRAKEDQLTAV